jgi:hypothetical protein
MAYLPFENTKIPAARSMSEIQTTLGLVGFEGTAQTTMNGVHTVYAIYKGVKFQFQIDVERIVKAFVDMSGPRVQKEIHAGSAKGKKRMLEYHDQALRVGWRLLTLHVKGVCDAVKLGVLTPSQAFAGHALLIGPDKKPITLAETLTAAIESGEIHSGKVLLLEENRGGR